MAYKRQSRAKPIEAFRGKSRVRWLLPIGIVIVVLVLGGLFFREVGLTYSAKDAQAQTQIVEIPAGLDTSGIGRLLVEEGIVTNARSFSLAAILAGARSELQAGVFELSAAQSPRDIVEVLRAGQTKEHTITIPEGLQLKEVAELFDDADIVERKDFLAAADGAYDYLFLSSVPPDANLEGFLFPDTYNFALDVTAEEVVDAMLANFGNRISDLLDRIEESDLDLFEIITLASIVEGEVPDDDDRKVVAGVFYNRLAEGIPLQADATLAFVTGEDRIDFTRADTQIDDPYNTYVIEGLPPGPINSPGLSSIEAVLNPTDTDFFYFVSDPDTGETIFAETLEEHNQNVAEVLGI